MVLVDNGREVMDCSLGDSPGITEARLIIFKGLNLVTYFCWSG